MSAHPCGGGLFYVRRADAYEEGRSFANVPQSFFFSHNMIFLPWDLMEADAL